MTKYIQFITALSLMLSLLLSLQTVAESGDDRDSFDDGYRGRSSYYGRSDKDRATEDCNRRMSEFESLKREFRSKCAGTTSRGCEAAAKECAGEGADDQNQSSGGWGSLANLLGGAMGGVLGSGMGYPNLGGMGSSSFTCLPKSTREQIKKDYDQLRKDAKEGVKDAEKYKREIEGKADEITKDVAALKEKFQQSLLEAKQAKIKLEAEVTQARDETERAAVEIGNAIDQNEQKKTESMGKLEEAQSQLGTLYTDSIQPCVDKLTTDKNTFLTDQYFKWKSEVQAAIDAEPDLQRKESIRQRKEVEMGKMEEKYKQAMKEQYDMCLRSATSAYKTKYNSLTTSIKQLNKDIESRGRLAETLNQKLAGLPEKLAQTIQGLRDNQKAISENSLASLQAYQSQIQSSVANYQSQYQDAQSSYQKAEMMLNMQQMNYQTNQSAFQMNSFGDAAPIIGDLEAARTTACNACLNTLKGVTKCPPGDVNPFGPGSL